MKADIARLYEAKTDYMPGLTSDEKKARLDRMSYAESLVKVAKADPGVIPVFQAMTHGEWGVGIDAVGALEGWAFHMPGFQGLALEPGQTLEYKFTRGSWDAVERAADGSDSPNRVLTAVTTATPVTATVEPWASEPEKPNTVVGTFRIVQVPANDACAARTLGVMAMSRNP